MKTGYRVYLNKLLLPVTPEKIDISFSGMSSSHNLNNGGEYRVLQGAEPKEIKFDFLLPNRKYPFAIYEEKNGKEDYIPASFFVMCIEQWTENKMPIRLKIQREFLDGRTIWHTDLEVSVENFSVTESAEYGFDYMASISLKELRHFESKVVDENNSVVDTAEKRSTENEPTPKSAKSYTVVSGDSLWSIAHKFYGDGNKYDIIFQANRGTISNPNKIMVGQVISIPAI